MNRQHLQAFLWLRWRLLVNQLRRGGIANAVILALLAGAVVLLAVTLFVVSLLVGLFVLPRASPAVLMYVWDGLVVVFLFLWAIGLLTELQRSEALSLDRFLHLPVSLTGAFLINYLSSLLSVTLILFLPPMLGLCLALVFAKGPALLLLFPLLAAFLFLVTAVTYQFQGWLASLMVNKRRRRTVIVAVTMSFILLCQLPNLLNIIRPWKGQKRDELAAQWEEAQAEWQRAGTESKAAPEYVAAYKKYQERKKEIEPQIAEMNRQTLQHVEQTFRLVNAVVPLGWLPLGAMDLAEGDARSALLGTLGLSLLGAASLWRSYKTTVRLYTGQFSSGKKRPVTVAPPPRSDKASSRLLEKSLPWLSEHTSAIAMAGMRSLTRAPEVKMMLLGPVIMIFVFGSMLFAQRLNPPEIVRPLMASGALALTLMTLVGLVGNQFGFDRSGFRVFVLCPARRRDILLGKNLAIAPLVGGLGAGAVLLLQVLFPMRVDHFLAALLQLVSMYLVFCLLANLLSILAPMPIAAGSLKPANPKMIPILLQVAFVFLFPAALAPTLLPLGAEFLVEQLGWVQGVPICLGLSLVECVAVGYLYRLVLTWQGALLQAREQRILETVTTKAE